MSGNPVTRANRLALTVPCSGLLRTSLGCVSFNAAAAKTDPGRMLSQSRFPGARTTYVREGFAEAVI